MSPSFRPAALRLLLCGALLLLWAPLKIGWEQSIEREQNLLRYHGAVLNRHLRDELGQGMTIGVLAGMRSVVADFAWLQVTVNWEHHAWFKMEATINLCTSLQPRSETFWDIGGWQLAWNASDDARWNTALAPEKRLHDSRFWIQRGLNVYRRGIENNPEKWRLWADTGLLYQMRLKDYHRAAYYYAQANRLPGVPVFYERFPAIMLDERYANDLPAAYAAWVALWERLTPAQREEKPHWKEKIEASIRRLETKLAVPPEKRIFPNKP